MGLDASPMPWWEPANERGGPSDDTFSSSRLFRHAAFGFRFRSGTGTNTQSLECTCSPATLYWLYTAVKDVWLIWSWWTAEQLPYLADTLPSWGLKCHYGQIEAHLRADEYNLNKQKEFYIHWKTTGAGFTLVHFTNNYKETNYTLN